MARSRGRRPQQSVRGFRPGKEPPRLKKERAKQQFGDVNAAQERLIEVFSERTPEESRTLMARWRLGLIAGAIVLAAFGAALYLWSLVAGIIAHVLAAALLFFWFQLRRQREGLEAMADVVSGAGAPRRPRGS